MPAWSIAILACHAAPAALAGDASWRYRGDNLARALAQAGHEVVCAPLAACPARRFDLVVLVRPLDGWGLRRRLAAWRRAGTRVLADVDDLVFEPALAPESPGVRHGRVSEAAVRERFERHRRALRQVDALSVSTAALARAWQDQAPAGQPLMRLPNAVHLGWQDLPDTPWPARHPAIAYFSGTRSHDHDLALAAPGLAEALRAAPHWRLRLVGPVAPPPGIPADQLECLPRQPFLNGYVDAVRASQLALMPLAPGRFNACKSALKVLEAHWWNVPVLASPLEDAERLQGPGLSTVASQEGWADALRQAMAAHDRQTHRPDLRAALGPEAQARDWARCWQDWVAAELAPTERGAGRC